MPLVPHRASDMTNMRWWKNEWFTALRDRLLRLTRTLTLRQASKLPKMSRKPFRFLDLPLEIRMHVYDCFFIVPRRGYNLMVDELARTQLVRNDRKMAYNSDDLKDNPWGSAYAQEEVVSRLAMTAEAFPIMVTRKSLLRVSRKIQVEWAPMFYKSTTVIVHGANHANLYRQIRAVDYGGNAPRFQNWLYNLQPYKLSNIRHLEYDASTTHVADFSQLKQLALLLSKKSSALQSLETVTLAVQADHDIIFPLSTDVAKRFAWREAIGVSNSKWDLVQQQFQSGTQARPGPLKEWFSERVLRKEVRMGGLPRIEKIVKASLLFYKEKPLHLVDDGTMRIEVVNDVTIGYDEFGPDVMD